MSSITTEPIDARRQSALLSYHKRLTELRQNENTLKERKCIAFPSTIERLGLKKLSSDFEKSENDIKALQSVGQIIGEIIKSLDADRCKLGFVTTS